jgi:hypothetical protein
MNDKEFFMLKKWIVFFMSLFFFANLYAAEISFHEVIPVFAQNIKTSGKHRIAVGNITYQETKLGSAFSVYLQGELSKQLEKSSAFEEFSRKDLEAILKEQELSQSDLFDEKTAIKLGALKSVQGMIAGEYIEAGQEIIINLRLLSLTTGKIVSTAQCRLSKTDIPFGIDVLPSNFDQIQSDTVQLPATGSLKIKVWVSKGEGGVYKDGEKLYIFFKANKDCYVRLYHIDVNGVKQSIYPNQFVSEKMQVKANKTYVFPDQSMNFDFTLGAPYGSEQIFAIAQTQPFTDKLTEGELSGKTGDVLTKGLVVGAKKNEVANGKVIYTIVK